MTELDEVSDKVCKLLGTQRTYREGLLFKRQRGLHSNQKKLKFQERFCRLTSHSLDYYDPHPKKRDIPKGQFAVQQIRIIETMPSDIFGKDYAHLHPFQVGDNSEIMYFCTKTMAEREDWVLAFRKVSRDKCSRMLSHYHQGIFGFNMKGRWGCCGSPQRAASGCSPVPEKQSPPSTPQAHRTMSIIAEDFSGGKSRADTFADFTMAGGGEGEGGGGAWEGEGGIGDRGKISGSESPQDSPRVRSFTLIAPVRSKPDPKKAREAGGKRSTMDFDHLEGGKREFEPLKEIEEVRRKPAQAWSSDLPAEGDEGKRASSPSPSEDSGKGTSTGSSRPSSQVISVDTEEGMRPGRSWSLGKNNVLSPLTDQVAPAPPPSSDGGRVLQGVARGPSGTEETDGHSGEGGGGGRKIREDGPRQELEDTLKARPDPARMQRNMSSPPGIGGDSEEEEDLVQPLASLQEVQLRNKIPASHSMDAITKRESMQLPPSPLVNVRRFNYPDTPTPTNSTPTHSSNRLSKVSNTSNSSNSPQLKPRQSVMLAGGLGMDRPDATLRRRRTIEEYSPLHRACRDGNVAALWDMLNGSVLAELEELAFNGSAYTPLFLAFLNDHYQAMECLLEHGADPSATEPVNRAPVLHLACERGCSDVVDLLLAYNVDVNQRDSRGNTALWQACRNGHLDLVERLLQRGALVNMEGENQRTPLHEAASSGHASIVKVLLMGGGADPCLRDSQYATPYDLAYKEGHEEVMSVLQRLMPEEVRPYSLLHSHTPPRHLMVTSLVFTDSSTLVSGSRDCHATFWDMSEEELSIKKRVRQQDSVLGVEKWAEHLVVSSTFVTLNSLEDLAQRRIVADDTREDESLTNPPLHFASFGAKGVLATASVEGHVVKVWPAMSPQAGLPLQPQARLEVGVSKDSPQPGIIHSLSVSRSAEHPWVAVGLQPGSLFQPQGNKTVHLYNWQEGKVHQIFDAGSGGRAVTVHTTFSPCGRQLAVGCHENLCIWEPETGDLLYKFTTSKKLAVTGLSYAPNGANLAVGLVSGEVQVFEIESSSCIFTLQPHQEYPSAASALAYSEDGRLLAVGHRNGQIQIWRAYTGDGAS